MSQRADLKPATRTHDKDASIDRRILGEQLCRQTRPASKPGTLPMYIGDIGELPPTEIRHSCSMAEDLSEIRDAHGMIECFAEIHSFEAML
ncbi:hypothetical protein, partial [Agrobacterium tumefaciens]|uniref:hypothetical protein n=1 Tax=Agrobacterium tumefaciens TaxID=358 RepID=UPI003BA10D23